MVIMYEAIVFCSQSNRRFPLNLLGFYPIWKKAFHVTLLSSRSFEWRRKWLWIYRDSDETLKTWPITTQMHRYVNFKIRVDALIKMSHWYTINALFRGSGFSERKLCVEMFILFLFRSKYVKPHQMTHGVHRRRWCLRSPIWHTMWWPSQRSCKWFGNDLMIMARIGDMFIKP